MKNNGKGKAPPGGAKKRPGVILRNPTDVRRLLSRNINQVLVDELDTDKLRAISYACQTILKCFELTMLEGRLDRLETILSKAGIQVNYEPDRRTS